jgi:F-type H+-transporting ATPase subunit a
LVVGLAVFAWLAGALSLARGQGHEDKHHDEGKAHATAEHEGHEAEHTPNALEHVMDQLENWEIFHTIYPQHLPLPKIFGIQISKYMLLELITAGLICLIYIPMAKRVQSGAPPKGWWDNCFEVLLTFVRNEMARPNFGEHDADKYVPFLWTMFLFILFNNLLGMVPFAGSATASITVTVALAIIVFFAIHGSAIAKMGFGHYVASMWPHIDVPFPLGLIIKPLVFVLEWIGVLVRNLVLAIRLFANMFAGHMVLATILIFIYAAGKLHPALWATVTVSSVLGILALSLLEIFVAFLQAYIFTFLASLFMGMALHPSH